MGMAYSIGRQELTTHTALPHSGTSPQQDTVSSLNDLGFPGSSEIKNPPVNAGGLSWVSGLGRSPEEGNGNPLQYPGLENPKNNKCFS